MNIIIHGETYLRGMTQTEQYELRILKEIIRHASEGGMREEELKKLFYNVLGGRERGEEFYTYLRTKTKYLSNNKGTDTNLYFLSAEGGFHLDNLQWIFEEENKIKTRRKLAFSISLITLGVAIATLVYTCHPMIHVDGPYHSGGKASGYPNDSPTKSFEKHPDKAILDSLEVLSPNKSQLVQITYEKGTRNSAYGLELAELLKKNGYIKVTALDDNGMTLSEKKIYFLRLEQGYILVYINVY